MRCELIDTHVDLEGFRVVVRQARGEGGTEHQQPVVTRHHARVVEEHQHVVEQLTHAHLHRHTRGGRESGEGMSWKPSNNEFLESSLAMSKDEAEWDR
jgi:hypothetical protein